MNIEELPHLKSRLDRLDELLALLRELTAEQARLTAARQEVSKQIAELTDKTQKLMTFLDAAVKQHYGRRSEKLAEFGLQPFRSKLRTRRVGPEGQPLERNAAEAEAPASPENE
ncbi:MAG TPA: hypothetical protein VKM72_14935 [Thermoanaerobaculia bacterium]|nr:hypothetical protein [Thermoanaerobaculia bacterium]